MTQSIAPANNTLANSVVADTAAVAIMWTCGHGSQLITVQTRIVRITLTRAIAAAHTTTRTRNSGVETRAADELRTVFALVAGNADALACATDSVVGAARVTRRVLRRNDRRTVIARMANSTGAGTVVTDSVEAAVGGARPLAVLAGESNGTLALTGSGIDDSAEVACLVVGNDQL